MRILTSVKLALKRRAAIQKEIEAIDKMLAPFSAGADRSKPDGRKYRNPMSAASRAKIAAAARLRWKKAKAAGKSRL